MWRVWLLAVGCGRLHFDPIADGASPGDAFPAGLIHYWPIDEQVGATVVRDVVGGADATVMTPAVITASGHDGDGLDSVNGGYAFVPGTPADMAGQGQLTIAAWMQRSAVMGIEQVGQEFLGSPPTDELSIQLWLDGQAYFCVGSVCSTVANDDTSWHHYVMVFDGSLAPDARIAGYIDGAAQVLNPGSAIATTPSRTDIHFDLGSTGHNEGRDTGTIDDVRVYNYPLAPADVMQLYEGG